MSLAPELRQAGVWRAGERAAATGPVLATGHAALDAWLPGGGWPAAALTELLPAGEAIGTLALLMPALAGATQGGRRVAFVAPPHVPYAPALAAAGVAPERVLVVCPRGHRERLWALEQVLGSGACAAAVGWPGALAMAAARRLQLAAARGGCAGFLLRPPAAAREPSPAALRLALAPESRGLGITVLKCRGGWPGGHCVIDCQIVEATKKEP